MSINFSKTNIYNLGAPNGWWWLHISPAHITLIRGRPPLIDGEFPINMADEKPTSPFVEAECLKQLDASKGIWTIRTGVKKKGRIVADDENEEYVGKTVREMMDTMLTFAKPGCDTCDSNDVEYTTDDGLSVCNRCYHSRSSPKPIKKVRKSLGVSK